MICTARAADALADTFGLRSPWHALEDLSHAMESFLLFGLPLNRTRLWLLDVADPASCMLDLGLYAPAWVHAFGSGRPPVCLQDLLSTFGHARTVRIERMVFAVHGVRRIRSHG